MMNTCQRLLTRKCFIIPLVSVGADEASVKQLRVLLVDGKDPDDVEKRVLMEEQSESRNHDRNIYESRMLCKHHLEQN